MENKDNLYRVRLALAYVDENGVFRSPPEEVDMTKETLDKHNELAEQFNLPKHEVLDDPEARRARAEEEAAKQDENTPVPPKPEGKDGKGGKGGKPDSSADKGDNDGL